ncbi:uncharacterized protein LOC144027399 [Festucalex cinctus]
MAIESSRCTCMSRAGVGTAREPKRITPVTIQCMDSNDTALSSPQSITVPLINNQSAGGRGQWPGAIRLHRPARGREAASAAERDGRGGDRVQSIPNPRSSCLCWRHFEAIEQR